jgi:hypothetical protein
VERTSRRKRRRSTHEGAGRRMGCSCLIDISGIKGSYRCKLWLWWRRRSVKVLDGKKKWGGEVFIYICLLYRRLNGGSDILDNGLPLSLVCQAEWRKQRSESDPNFWLGRLNVVNQVEWQHHSSARPSVSFDISPKFFQLVGGTGHARKKYKK